MFNHEDILSRVHSNPFTPFRIVTADGTRYEIYQPKLVMPGRHDISIGFSGPDHPTIYHRIDRIAFECIVALETIPRQFLP